MRTNPRLLFLAYAFPPITTIGRVRAYNIAKWLTRKGWEVSVVTPYESAWGRSDSATDVHDELSREGIRCIRTAHRWRSLLPHADRRRRRLAWLAGGVSRRIASFLGIEREAGWFAEAAKACAALAPDDVDIILASGPPFGSFGLAKEIAERLGRPYVLDYRDLWTGNPHATRSAPPWVIERERSLLAASAAAIGVSPSLVESLRDQLGVEKPVYVIFNGFDPEELTPIPRHAFGHFAIVYAGTFYPPKRTAGPLMAALRRVERLSGSSRQWAFHYYGHQADYVRSAARDCNVDHRVVIHGSVPRRDAIAAIRGGNIAVVISSVYEQASLPDRGIVTGKVFDAIGVGTPLLVIAPEGSDLEAVLATTGLGRRFSGTQVEEIAEFLMDAMNGRTPRIVKSEPFNWANLGTQLDNVLRGVLEANRREPSPPRPKERYSPESWRATSE
jgi:glycosyltransferase involved in cell wall biosynthesis